MAHSVTVAVCPSGGHIDITLTMNDGTTRVAHLDRLQAVAADSPQMVMDVLLRNIRAYLRLHNMDVGTATAADCNALLAGRTFTEAGF